MKNSGFKFLTTLFIIFSFFLFPFSFSAQVRPVYDLGANGLAQMLKRLQTTASAMHTGAHPDDEDSGLLAYLARREMARTSYLSLTRGDGGQNVIGAELFENLGIIRTEELLQARRLDGGQQFFSRAMDFGFSKTRAEAARLWDEKEILGDMVRAIRLFRPLVIISRFAGTHADGHGQHQFAGYLTPLAFKAAADPNQFPEQIKEGLQAWQVKKLYVSQSFSPNNQNAPTLVLNTGEYDTLLGRSYYEIAAEGRSQHKTQEMGVLELRGKHTSGVRLVDTIVSKVERETSVFDGIDTSINGITKLTGETNDAPKNKLDELQKTAKEALEKYEPFAPQKLITVLSKGMRLARETKSLMRNSDAKRLLEQKENEFAQALQMAAGVVVDALSDSEKIVAGDAVKIAVRVFAPENAAVTIKNVSLNVPEGWTTKNSLEPSQPENTGFRSRRENALHASFFTVAAHANTRPTQPYWLENPRRNFTFDWKDTDAENLPFQTPLITAEIKLGIAGEEFIIEKLVQYRFADAVRGEIRRDVNIVPPVSIELESNLVIAPVSDKAKTQKLVVSVTNNAPRETKGTLKFDSP
jgi:LmbE family N-acetylglucosaminyl deacetylase